MYLYVSSEWCLVCKLQLPGTILFKFNDFLSSVWKKVSYICICFVWVMFSKLQLPGTGLFNLNGGPDNFPSWWSYLFSRFCRIPSLWSQLKSWRPGTDVMIFKIFSPRKSAKKWHFWLKSKAKLWKKIIITLVFEKNANFLRTKLAKSQKIVSWKFPSLVVGNLHFEKKHLMELNWRVLKTNVLVRTSVVSWVGSSKLGSLLKCIYLTNQILNVFFS
jgi:hypothetical protein